MKIQFVQVRLVSGLAILIFEQITCNQHLQQYLIKVGFGYDEFNYFGTSGRLATRIIFFPNGGDPRLSNPRDKGTKTLS